MFGLVLVACLLQSSLSAKILGLFCAPFVSHQSVYQSISKELSLRGHDVTVFTPNPLNDEKLTNLTEIDLSCIYEITYDEVSEIFAKNYYLINIILETMDYGGQILEKFLVKSKQLFQSNSTTSFDLILVEALHPLIYAFGCRFKVPIIGISSSEFWLSSYDAVGNPTHPTLSVDGFYNLNGDGLYERVSIVFYHIWSRLLYHWYLLPRYDKITKEYFGEDCPYLGDIEKNLSLLLVNTHPVLHPIRPNVPAVIQLGQVHIRPKKQLPKDLQNYLDQSPQGIVYFSLGSHLRSASLPENILNLIISALSELPYNVIWKWETDVLSNQPKNVLINKWLPQQDLLGHKNIKIFVTQAGLQSMEESIMNGVPMLAMPFLGDQFVNAKTIVDLGIGMEINQKTITKSQLKEVIIEVAENNTYRNEVKKIRNLLVDQPMSGLEKAVWWIEYTIRHKGANHLRSSAADMSFFEYFLLDVIFLVTMFMLIFICIVCLFFKLLKCARSDSTKFKRKNK